MRRFDRGECLPREEEWIADHLAACRVCEKAFQQIGDSSDTVARLVRDYRDPLPGNRDQGKAPRRDPTLDRLFAKGLPQRFDEYELLTVLGRGGSGAVFKARHVRLKRLVAIKILDPKSGLDEDAIARFHDEMEAIGQLEHPNIIRAIDAREFEGVHFLVMEFVEGLSLAEVLRFQTRLSVGDACEVIRQAAEGLEYAASKGLVHRDVKPSNLFLTHDGRVKVLDLGLASMAAPAEGPESRQPSHGVVVGTPDYIAPETWQGRDDIDARADVYGLGCTLYKLLTGEPPFLHCADANEKMRAHLREAPAPVGEKRPDVADELEQLVARMLAKDPSQRIESPRAVAKALEPHRAGSVLADLIRQARSEGDTRPIRAGDPTQTWDSPLSRRRTLPRRAIWVVTLLILAMGGAAALVAAVNRDSGIREWQTAVSSDNYFSLSATTIFPAPAIGGGAVSDN